MFAHTYTIRLHDTDAAGVLYFGAIFRIAHEAYEEFMESVRCDIAGTISEGRSAIPVVHAEADYASPLRLGDRIRVEVAPDQVGASSFSIRYRIIKDGKVAALVQTVHVSISQRTKKKTTLPPRLKSALARAL